MLEWLQQWWKAQPKVQDGDLLPALAARLLVAEVLGLPAAKELATACASRFTEAMRTGRTRFDEVTLLALGWCHLSTNRLVPAGIDADQLAAQLRAPAESIRQVGPERGTVDPRGPWATEAGRASATAMAWILETLGIGASRLARR